MSMAYNDNSRMLFYILNTIVAGQGLTIGLMSLDIPTEEHCLDPDQLISNTFR